MGSEEFVTFELFFRGREPELGSFSKEFNKVEWASKYLRRLGPENVAYMGGPPAEMIVLVVTVATNILKIAEILAQRLGKNKNTIIRLGKREIELKGSWKSEEIAEILNVVSSRISRKKAIEKAFEIKSSIIAETEEQIANIERTIQEYEGLVKTFEAIPQKKNWQIEKAKGYQKTLAKMQAECEHLRSFINVLKQNK